MQQGKEIHGISTGNEISHKTPILSLPAEITTIIIALGTPVEIAKWREVSQYFRAIVDTSPLLQYLLQLSQLGYIEPIKPRRDLTYADKTDFLHQYQKHLDNLGNFDPAQISFRDTHGFRASCGFSRGVFAHITEDFSAIPEVPGLETIYIYEIPSLNKAISECNVWSFSDLGVPLGQFGMSISLDLLLLFERNPTIPTNLDPWPDPALTMHLRSLRTSAPHPFAAVPILTFTPARTYMDFDISFRIIGDYVMLLLNMDGPYNKSELVIWDWPSGKKVAWLETEGDSFAFISPNIFVIPQINTSTFTNITELGLLDIFVLTPKDDGADPSTAFQYVATLQLPSVNSELSICMISVDSSTSPVVHPKVVPLTSTLFPETVYDVSPDDEILSVTLSISRDFEAAIEGSSAAGTLLIHHSSIRDLVQSVRPAPKPRPHTIPWPDWAERTVWAGSLEDEEFGAMFNSAGHFAAFVHGRQVMVYDVRPRYLASVESEQGTETTRSTGTSKRGSETSQTQITMSTELNRMFTTGSAGSCKPKVVASFGLPLELENPVIVMDEEHVILVDQTELGYKDRIQPWRSTPIRVKLGSMQQDSDVAPRTAPILLIPSEVITIIISLCTATEITRWREVSRIFKEIVDGSPLLQYLLQLSQLDYIEPLKPRRDLSYNDKTEFLRQYQTQLEGLGKLDPTEIRFHGAHGPPTNCKFSRGVFAHTTNHRHIAIVDPMPDTIYVYEITSSNRATNECKDWSLTNFGVAVEEFGMSLAFDLLLLFEIHPTEFDSWRDSPLTIHLRSLRSGTAHPSVAVPSLTFTPKRPYVNFSISFRVVGDFVMLLFNMDGPYGTSEFIVWDWPSGKEVAWLETEGDSFAFISPNILVIPQINTGVLGEITNLGQLDIFVLDPRAQDNDFLTTIQHVATLQLPDAAPNLFMSIVSVDGSISPAVRSRTVPSMSPLVPETVYNVSANDEILNIGITVVRDSLGPIEHSSGMGTLLVHHSVIRDLLQPILDRDESHVRTIPWLDWAERTVWAGTLCDEAVPPMFYSAGHLASFVHGRQVVVYDVRPRHLASRDSEVERPEIIGSAEAQERESETGAVLATMNVELDRMFTTGNYQPRKPKIVSSFKIPDALEDPVIVMDEEHIILIDRTRLGYKERMYVYSF